MPTDYLFSVRFEMRATDAWMHKVDEWRREQVDSPSRAEAIRRLVERGLEAPTQLRTPSPSPPFAQGDRVHHKLFGLGTVVERPVPSGGPDRNSLSGVRDAGWRVTVRWDEPDKLVSKQEVTSVGDHILKAAGERGHA